MRKISQLQREEAIEVLGNIIEPTATILVDKDVRKIITGGGAPIKAVKIICKKYAHEIIEVMAGIEGVSPDEFECNVFTLPVMLLEVLNDEELKDFFTSQVLETSQHSMSPAEDTIDTAQ